jgi:hypothetical protein
MGADGIFFDYAGWDLQVDRSRLNQAVEYAHNKGMKVILNAWNPDEVLSDAYHETYNPARLPASVLPGDGYLFESFRISHGAYQDLDALAAKSDKCLAYRQKMGVKIYCVATGDDTGKDTDFQDKFSAFWISFTHYGFNYYQYTNPLYSASDGPDGEPWANRLNYHDKDSGKPTLVVLEQFKAVIQGNMATAGDKATQVTQEGNTATLQGNKATVQGDKATVQGNKATVQGNKAVQGGYKAIPQGKMATPEGNKSALQGDKATQEGAKTTPHANRVLITWRTLSEIDIAGFNLWRSESEDKEYIKINPRIIEATGGATRGAEYSYTDDTVKPGLNYYYKLEEINTRGSGIFQGTVSSVIIPASEP